MLWIAKQSIVHRTVSVAIELVLSSCYDIKKFPFDFRLTGG
ncbi:MAG TPA: hypothetical protein VLH40_02000 [Atribacteraceae bacterium]|nr:hypothetical protein [Atribacteraceae bacterium]